MCIARRVPQVPGVPAGVNRPAEAALRLEECAHLWARAEHPEYAGSGSRPVPLRDQCKLAVASVDGLARSDATDKSPLHRGPVGWLFSGCSVGDSVGVSEPAQ